MKTMLDKNSNIVKVGHVVRYHYEGNDKPDPGLLKVVRISCDLDYLKYYGQYEKHCTTPYAILREMDSGVTLNPPFFSHEISKPEIEELI